MLRVSLYLFLFSFCAIPPLFASVHPKETEADKTIQAMYQDLKNYPSQHFTEKLANISAQFLGMPYVLGSLGEGADADFDQFPRYRTDGFDCETFVTTVLALTLAENAEQFPKYLQDIRYEKSKTDYVMRNHFTELDWNLNNAKKGFIKDITLSIRDKNNQAVAKTAEALINKPAWFQSLTQKNIRLQDASQQEKDKRLEELREKGKSLSKTYSRLAYIPFSILFHPDGSPNYFIFSQIPDGSIVEIVRPNWELKKIIGTNLNVSHLGFAFWDHGMLLFRQASSQYGYVVDVPLIRYLKEARKSPTIQGINIQKPNDPNRDRLKMAMPMYYPSSRAAL